LHQQYWPLPPVREPLLLEQKESPAATTSKTMFVSLVSVTQTIAARATPTTAIIAAAVNPICFPFIVFSPFLLN
jgi:hypothetical protein